MELYSTLVIVILAATTFWLYTRLKERIELIEHEVRWLRQELETLKPTQIRSAEDRT